MFKGISLNACPSLAVIRTSLILRDRSILTSQSLRSYVSTFNRPPTSQLHGTLQSYVSTFNRPSTSRLHSSIHGRKRIVPLLPEKPSAGSSSRCQVVCCPNGCVVCVYKRLYSACDVLCQLALPGWSQHLLSSHHDRSLVVIYWARIVTNTIFAMGLGSGHCVK